MKTKVYMAKLMSLLTADGPAVEGLKMEVQVGPRAAKTLLKKINANTETPKVRSILQKLREIFDSGQGNNSSSSTRFFNHKTLSLAKSSSIHSFSSSRSTNSQVSFYHHQSHFSLFTQYITMPLMQQHCKV